jgi:tRNA G10  N-methylase Trm11
MAGKARNRNIIERNFIMNYKYATENMNYEDYSSGRVFYNQHGTTSFPARLSSEIFQYCSNILENNGVKKPFSIYDPCCGGAYLLTTLGYLHGDSISEIYASDVNADLLPLMEKNLSLLTLEGINHRIEQINRMINDYGKPSHVEALKSGNNLKTIMENRKNAINTHCFIADITKDPVSEQVGSIDMIITDLPYGEVVQWSGDQDENTAVTKLLDNIFTVLKSTSVAAVISSKNIKIEHKNFKRIKRFSIGKRQIVILQPII